MSVTKSAISRQAAFEKDILPQKYLINITIVDETLDIIYTLYIVPFIDYAIHVYLVIHCMSKAIILNIAAGFQNPV